MLGTHTCLCRPNMVYTPPLLVANRGLWKVAPGELGRPLGLKGLDSRCKTRLLIFVLSSSPTEPSSLSNSSKELASLTPSPVKLVRMSELRRTSQSSNSYSTTRNCSYRSSFWRNTAIVCASCLAATFISFIRRAVSSSKCYKAGSSRYCYLIVSSRSLRLSSASL